MDLASLIGFGLCTFFLIFGILSGGGNFAWFIDPPSLLITVGGALGATMASYKMDEFINGLKGLTLALKEPSKQNPAESISTIIGLSNTARKEGLLALDEATQGIEDPFLRKGIMLVVDGTDPDLVRGILETELSAIEGRHKKVTGVLDRVGEMGPAWGMIGTLIGLIIMLQNMSDAASIGPAMAVALITTMYGSLLANWIFGPLSEKLKDNTSHELMMKEVVVEGILSIQAGENPRVIEEKLKTFLSPKAREAVASSDDGGGEG
ncbi:MAG: motility protein A [Lachnospiraceae bacterium]|nr:motility protein A [Lachnospiraceae bacterium]